MRLAIKLLNINQVLTALKFCFATFLVFSLLYHIELKHFPINSSRFAIVIAFIYCLIYKKLSFQFFFKHTNTILILFLPFLYAIFLYYYTRDYGILARFINLFIYGFIGSYLIATIIGCYKNAIYIFMTAILIQAVFIFLALLSIEFKQFLSESTINYANYDAFNLSRSLGFSGSSGASLSLIQSCGILLMALHFKFKPRNDKHITIFVVLSCFIIFLSMLVTGRTGILVSLCYSALIIYYILNTSKVSTYIYITLITTLFFSLSPLIYNYLSNHIPIDYILNWVLSIFSGENKSLTTLKSFPIPNLNHNLIHGYGLVSLVDGYNPSRHDSGIVQFYYAYGIPMAIIFYSAYLFTLLKITKWMGYYFSLVVTVIFLGIELKEPFIFKYSSFFILMTFYFLTKIQKNIVKAK